jgi:hypothetical protein
MELSPPEQQLLDFSRERFGGPLSRFLLSGLSEEREARSRVFVITFIGNTGSLVCRRVQVEADDLAPDIPTYLPHAREPLVMLALLRLLTSIAEIIPVTLFYEPTEVLGLLGWENSAENRLAVEEVVERYSLLSYRWEMSAEELSAERLSFHRSRERFVSGYSHGEADELEEGHGRRRVNRVDFSLSFVEELLGRLLFGVEWDRVSNVEIAAAN